MRTAGVAQAGTGGAETEMDPGTAYVYEYVQEQNSLQEKCPLLLLTMSISGINI